MKTLRNSSLLSPLKTASLPLRQLVASQVISFFNDRTAGDNPVAHCDNRLFGRRSVAWRVHGDVTTMMVGGIAALLLQMLHPTVLAGVWDHSNFRSDMHGRLRRTARFVALTTYGEPKQAEAAIARVNAIHSGISGVLPSGQTYHANDPEALAWVHTTEATCFLAGWMRYAEPSMSKVDRNCYFAEMAQVARALGANPVPTTESEAHNLIKATRPLLSYDARTKEVARLILSQPAPNVLTEPFRVMTVQGGIDLLPYWAQQSHGFQTPMLAKPFLRGTIFGAAQILRQALS